MLEDDSADSLDLAFAEGWCALLKRSDVARGIASLSLYWNSAQERGEV